MCCFFKTKLNFLAGMLNLEIHLEARAQVQALAGIEARRMACSQSEVMAMIVKKWVKPLEIGNNPTRFLVKRIKDPVVERNRDQWRASREVAEDCKISGGNGDNTKRWVVEKWSSFRAGSLEGGELGEVYWRHRSREEQERQQ